MRKQPYLERCFYYSSRICPTNRFGLSGTKGTEMSSAGGIKMKLFLIVTLIMLAGCEQKLPEVCGGPTDQDLAKKNRAVKNLCGEVMATRRYENSTRTVIFKQYGFDGASAGKMAGDMGNWGKNAASVSRCEMMILGECTLMFIRSR